MTAKPAHSPAPKLTPGHEGPALVEPASTGMPCWLRRRGAL